MADPTDLANVQDVELAWRSLTPTERSRAEYWIGAASRRIRRRWPDVDARITNGTLDAKDVSDVVVNMVITLLPTLENAGQKSWSIQAGAEAKSVTLETGRLEDRLKFENWMIEIFEGAASRMALPKIAAPRPYGLNTIFPDWKEVYDE